MEVGEDVQRTLQKPVIFEGVGLHSGKIVRMTISPAEPDTGIVFYRCDLKLPHMACRIDARWDLVEQTPLCTRLVNNNGVSLSTCEHVMAAISGCGLHNLSITVDGPEIPILDGSAIEFVRGMLDAGIVEQEEKLLVLRVLKTIRYETADGWAQLSPSHDFRISFEIDFPDEAIGSQRKTMSMNNGQFLRELSDSRTFCRLSDVRRMRENGLALGGTIYNAVVVDGASILSPGGLRHQDEAVRHKMLDAVGDLALAGAPIIGHYTGKRAGHAMTNGLLRSLFADGAAYRLERCAPSHAHRLPGFGIDIQELDNVA